MLQSFNKKNTALNRPCLEETVDTLTIQTAASARLRDRNKKLGV